MVDKTTIDNLGLEASNAYARSKEALKDVHFIEESYTVPQRVETLVTAPHAPSEYEAKFGLGQVILWAALAAPPDTRGAALLYTFQLIPTLGSEDDQQALLDKITALADSLSKEPNVQDQYKKILSLLKLLDQLERTFDLINGRRLQYHKG